VFVTTTPDAWSRITEVEAWTATGGGGNLPPSVTLTNPAPGAVFEAPATITLDATADDPDGTVTQVEFFVDGASVGSDGTSPYNLTLTNIQPGNYTLTAVATDDDSATTTSSPVAITVTDPDIRTNVALAANGGVATASSTHSAGYAASGAINGDRRGLSWGAGGGWNDGTANAFPDWLEVQFNGAQTIDEINVFSVQDSYTSPADPTLGMTFSLYGLRNFEVQYWTGSAWAPVPGGSVTSNNLVWRQFVFAPITTTRIRVFVTGTPDIWSRIPEVEAWTASGGGS
jgi:hypothetical protein